jgi:hypothetical protein
MQLQRAGSIDPIAIDTSTSLRPAGRDCTQLGLTLGQCVLM